MPTLWERRWVGLVVVTVVVALYAPTLVFGRVDFDDLWLWGDDSPLRQPSLSMLREVLFQLDVEARRPLGTEYLPVRDLLVAADMAVWGDNEQGPHLTQLLLYAATVLGMGTLLVGFGLRRDVAWLGTLLWAIHPSHVESVAWLSERKGILAGLFVIVCGHAWLRFRRSGRRRWLAVSALAAVAGVWSKAPAMFGPVALAALDMLLLPRDRRRWEAVGVIGGATLLAAIPVILVAQDGRIVTDTSPSLADRFTLALGSLGHYVQSLLLIQRPSISYALQTDGPSLVDLGCGVAAVLTCAAALAIRHEESRRWRQALVCWALVWFVPISHLLAPIHIAVADRYIYLWVLAGCVGVAWAIQRVPAPWQLLLAGGVVCALGISTIRAQQAWTSTVELYANAHDENPRDPKTCENYAMALVAEAQRDRALLVLDRCLRELPNHPYLLEAKARMYERLDQRDRALELSALAALGGQSSSMWNHALRLERAGQLDQALLWARRAALRRPQTPAFLRTYAELLLAAGRVCEAEMLARVVLLIAPTPPHHLLVAKTLLAQARRETAEIHLAEAAKARWLAVEVERLRAER